MGAKKSHQSLGFISAMRSTSLYLLQLWPHVLAGNCTNFCSVHLAYLKCLQSCRYHQHDGAMWSHRKRTDGVSSSALTSMGPWASQHKKPLHYEGGLGGGAPGPQPVQNTNWNHQTESISGGSRFHLGKLAIVRKFSALNFLKINIFKPEHKCPLASCFR